MNSVQECQNNNGVACDLSVVTATKLYNLVLDALWLWS